MAVVRTVFLADTCSHRAPFIERLSVSPLCFIISLIHSPLRVNSASSLTQSRQLRSIARAMAGPILPTTSCKKYFVDWQIFLTMSWDCRGRRGVRLGCGCTYRGSAELGSCRHYCGLFMQLNRQLLSFLAQGSRWSRSATGQANCHRCRVLGY